MEGVQPFLLVRVQQLGPHGGQVDGAVGDGLKAQELAVLVLHPRAAQQLVLDADAHLALFVDAGLVGDDHAGFEHRVVGDAQVLGAFVYAAHKAHAVAGTAAVVDAVGPHRGAGDHVQVAAGAGVQELELGHVDVALEHVGVIGALVVSQFTQGVGAGDVGGAVQILAAAVHQ